MAGLSVYDQTEMMLMVVVLLWWWWWWWTHGQTFLLCKTDNHAVLQLPRGGYGWRLCCSVAGRSTWRRIL